MNSTSNVEPLEGRQLKANVLIDNFQDMIGFYFVVFDEIGAKILNYKVEGDLITIQISFSENRYNKLNRKKVDQAWFQIIPEN